MARGDRRTQGAHVPEVQEMHRRCVATGGNVDTNARDPGISMTEEFEVQGQAGQAGQNADHVLR